MWVKICGVKEQSSVELIASAGADAVGFVLDSSSPRYVSMDVLPSLVAKASSLEKVAVLTRKALSDLSGGDHFSFFSKLKGLGVDTVQFHGFGDVELAGTALSAGLHVIRAFLESENPSPEALHDWLSFRVMLDSGYGSGKTVDWELARKFVEAGYRLILSGGLTPGNVVEAIKSVSPFGVDVSSGVESAPGVKDPEKVKAFVDAVRSV